MNDLLHDRRSLQGFQGIRDDGLIRFVLYRRDVGCPEDRCDVDEECGINHAPSKANPVAKNLDYENVLEIVTLVFITWVHSPAREAFREPSDEQCLRTYKRHMSCVQLWYVLEHRNDEG